MLLLPVIEFPNSSAEATGEASLLRRVCNTGSVVVHTRCVCDECLRPVRYEGGKGGGGGNGWRGWGLRREKEETREMVEGSVCVCVCVCVCVRAGTCVFESMGIGVEKVRLMWTWQVVDCFVVVVVVVVVTCTGLTPAM